jgi:hypothetical protein
MSSFALRRSSAVNLEATMSPAGPPINPLEEFAGLMGVDVSALERFDGAGAFVTTSGASHEFAASEMEGSTRVHEAETSLQGSSLLSEAMRPADLYRSVSASVAESRPTSRRSGALMLGVLVVAGAAGCLGYWTLEGEPYPPGTSTMQANIPLKLPSIEQKTAALRDESASIPPDEQTGKPGPVDLASSEKQPPAFDEQAGSPTPVPSAASTPTPTEVAPSAMTAAAAASVSAEPPATRSLALPSSAPEPPQAAVSSLAPQTGRTPEPKRPKMVSVRSNGSALTDADGTPVEANHPSPPSAARTPTASSDKAPPLLNPPTPVERPSFDASAGGVPRPTKKTLDASAEVSTNSVDYAPVAKVDAIAPDAPPPANVTADSGGEGFSAKSVLQVVPNLYEKAAGALRGSPNETPVAATDPTAPSIAEVAPAPSGGSFSAGSVLQIVPSLYETAASALRGSPPETPVARVVPKPTAADNGGAYGVQFAAPATEPAARKASDRLRSKYAIELGGLQPTVRQAEFHGRKIYQVRIGSMSKADAAALCRKVKSSGGEAACSVASD